MCASWFEDKSEQGGNGAQGEPATGHNACPPARDEHPPYSVQAAAGPTRQGDGGSEKRRAAPDLSGLGPGWQRRGIDRDALDDIISDGKQAEDWERVLPSDGSGIEGYW